MSTEIMTFLLLRLAIIFAGVVVLAIIAITLLVVLKRRGHLDRARSFAEPAVRGWAERPSSGGGDALRRAAVRGALGRLDHAVPPDESTGGDGHGAARRGDR